MSDEEDFNEFPSITVNSSMHESSTFSMPSAEQLAQQRARELACERELLLLREGSEAAPAVSTLAHSDSSSSEAEAALAAAVGVLRVHGSPATAPPPLRGILRALRGAAGSAGAALVDAHLAALEAASPARVAALTDQIASRLGALVAGPWDPDEALGAAAWLCAACARPPAPRAARRVLHALLEDELDDDQAERLGAALAGALEAGAALELGDALRGSGGARGARLAARVMRTALWAEGGAGAGGEGWRRLAPARQYRALQLLARLQGEGSEERRLLAAVLPATAHKDKTTDTLKVLVAASKLQVLFNLQPAPTPTETGCS